MLSSRPSLTWFTVLLIAWASVWCCCRPAEAANTSHTRACCATVERPVHPCPTDPASPDNCPVVRVRESSVAPTLVPPVVQEFVLALPTWQVMPALLPMATPSRAASRIEPATGPPTLLDLHTSLLT